MSFSAHTTWNPAFDGRPAGPFPRRSAEIGAVVLTFFFAWPAALAYVVWKFAGYPLPADWRGGLDRARSSLFGFGRGAVRSGPVNHAFEEYRRAELARLEEERRRLDEESRAFSTFVEELKQAKDREEFEAFMARRRGGHGAA